MKGIRIKANENISHEFCNSSTQATFFIIGIDQHFRQFETVIFYTFLHFSNHFGISHDNIFPGLTVTGAGSETPGFQDSSDEGVGHRSVFKIPDTAAFEHSAFYDEQKTRIEMHLVSSRAQIVRLDAIDLVTEFEQGESIRTELSHKYTRDSVEELLAAGGLRLAAWETDPAARFALALARRP